MKKLFIYLTIAGAFTAMTACDKGFEDVNVNPVLATSIDPAYLFSNAEFGSAIATQFYQMQIVQQINSPYTGVMEGGNHNVVYDPNSNANFNSLYLQNGPVNLLTTVLAQTKDDPARSNLYQMSRIWKAYVFMVLVDTYGDVPYFEAGKAYLAGINLPVYDDQKLIYDDILKELEEGTQALDATKAIEAADLFYKGNIAQWKKLGNSLLLRAAMRYTRIDEAKAKTYLAKAVDPANGGLQSSNADNALIAFNSTFNHPLAGYFQGTERANNFLGEAFVTYLKTAKDPRLKVIAVKYETPGNPIATAGAEDTDPANQIGMPYGYNESTITNAPGYPGKIGSAFKYSQINRKTLGKIDAPEFFITYSQTLLLQAEAVQRGWITGDAKALYVSGIKAHMSQLTTYDPLATISEADQNTFVAANPLDAAKALEQINSQYWVSSFLNGSEAWANFRRSSFPALPINTYPGKDPSVTDFIHRLVYPVREKSVNTNNYNAAVARMGADALGTHVFWDK